MEVNRDTRFRATSSSSQKHKEIVVYTAFMKMPSRLLLIATVIALMASAIIAPVATATKPNPEHKVTICHALPESSSHDYNRITVDIASSGYVKGGHHRPGGDIGDKHADGGDIIPPYTHGDFKYPGQNWTKKGQAIWENDCNVPPPPPPPNPKQSQELTFACVASPSSNYGVANTLKVTADWETNRELPLEVHVFADGKTINYSALVNKPGQKDFYKFLGRGRYEVTGYIKLGSQKVSYHEYVQCDPVNPVITDVIVTCVAGQNGIDTRVQVDVTYNTRHIPSTLPLWAKVRIDNELRMDKLVANVVGKGSWTRSWFAGQGDHYVTGYVRLGPVKKYLNHKVSCDVVDVDGWLDGPYEDPEYYATLVNESTMPIWYIVRYVQNGEVEKDWFKVKPGKVVETACEVFDPETKAWLNFVHPGTGKRIRLDTIEKTAPLDVYPSCPV